MNFASDSRCGIRLIATIAASFLVAGCASQNLARTSADLTSLERAFINGDASLTCELVCSGTWGASRRNLQKLYEQQQWTDLAAGVHQIGFNTDLSWLYIGRSAEGLGYIQAARIYYLKALSAEKKCKTILLDNCNDLDVPSLARDWLARLGGASTVTDLLPQQRYDAAFALAQRGDYDGAERAFPHHPS
ncbi:hypothetical protein, partial [Magnetospirillum sp. SS-4]|uniref:hypothetical protein n=1 Tax=Magnetospirillum sp. SS-4 TaxID=2681465 RepID=UPI001C2CCF98